MPQDAPGRFRGPSSPTPVAATPPLRRRLPPRLSTPAKFDRGPSLVRGRQDGRAGAAGDAVVFPTPFAPASLLPTPFPRPSAPSSPVAKIWASPRRRSTTWPPPPTSARPSAGIAASSSPIPPSPPHTLCLGRDGLGLLFHRIKDLGEGIPLIKCWKLNHSSVQANFAVELPVLQCGLCIAQVLGLTPGLICSVPIDSKGRDKTEIVVKV